MAVEMSDALKHLSATITKSTESYTEAISDLNKMYGKGARSKREQGNAERKAEVEAIKKTVDMYDEVAKATRKWKAEEKHRSGASVEAAEELAATIDKLKKSGQVSSIHLMNTMRNINNASQTVEQNVDDMTEALHDELKVRSKQLKQADRVQKHTNELMRGFDKLKDSVLSAADEFFSLKGGIANIGAGFARSFDELEYSMKHQAEMYTLLSGVGTTWAADMALAPAEMQNMVAENRRLIHSAASDYTDASGAVTQAVTSMNRQTTAGTNMLTEAYKLTGNFKDASALMMGTMNMLQGLGINKPFDQLGAETEKLMSTFTGLSRVTGQSSEAIQQQVAQYFQSAEVREELMKMNKKQRKNRVLEVAKSMEYQVMLGKSTQAALEAQKAMSKIAGMDARSRLKESAIMRAVSGGLGMKSGARMSELFNKPTRTADEEREFRDLADQMSRLYKGQQAKGGPEAMVAEAMFKKMSGETQGIITAQNTQMDQGFKLSQNQYDLLKDSQPKLGKIEDLMKSSKTFWDQNIRGLLLDPGLQIFGGILGILKEILVFAGMSVLLSKAGLAPLQLLQSGLSKAFPTFIGLGTKLSTLIGVNRVGMSGIGRSVGLLGAAWAGWEIGKEIGDYWETNSPESRAAFGDMLGSAVDNIAAVFGNENAQKRLDIMDEVNKYKDDAHKTAVENAAKMEELINALIEATKEGNDERRDLINSQIKALNTQTKVITEQTEIQKESEEKNREQAKTDSRLKQWYVPA